MPKKVLSRKKTSKKKSRKISRKRSKKGSTKFAAKQLQMRKGSRKMIGGEQIGINISPDPMLYNIGHARDKYLHKFVRVTHKDYEGTPIGKIVYIDFEREEGAKFGKVIYTIHFASDIPGYANERLKFDLFPVNNENKLELLGSSPSIKIEPLLPKIKKGGSGSNNIGTSNFLEFRRTIGNKHHINMKVRIVNKKSTGAPLENDGASGIITAVAINGDNLNYTIKLVSGGVIDWSLDPITPYHCLYIDMAKNQIQPDNSISSVVGLNDPTTDKSYEARYEALRTTYSRMKEEIDKIVQR